MSWTLEFAQLVRGPTQDGPSGVPFGTKDFMRTEEFTSDPQPDVEGTSPTRGVRAAQDGDGAAPTAFSGFSGDTTAAAPQSTLSLAFSPQVSVYDEGFSPADAVSITSAADATGTTSASEASDVDVHGAHGGYGPANAYEPVGYAPVDYSPSQDTGYGTYGSEPEATFARAEELPPSLPPVVPVQDDVAQVSPRAEGVGEEEFPVRDAGAFGDASTFEEVPEPAAAAAVPSPSTSREADAAMAVIPRPTAEKKATKRRRRWPIWTAAAVLVLLGVVGLGGFAYASHYSDVAVPGSTVAGVDVAGMSRDQIITAVEERASNITVSIDGDASANASLTDLGVTVDAEATADAVMARGAHVVDRFTALISDGDVPVVTTSEPTTAVTYAASLIPSDRAVAQDATIELDDAGTGFDVVPGSEGTRVDSDPLTDAATDAASSLSSTSVTVSYESSSPSVSDAEAQAVADEANGRIAQDVTVTGTTVEGTEDSFSPDASTKASWITVTPQKDAVPTLGLDQAKITDWVTAQADDINAEPVKGKRNVNSRGEVVATSVEAVDGQNVDNVDAVATAIAQAMTGNKNYTGAFETTEVKATWEERTIAAGAENLPYQAAEGEKWIDINLTNKTVTAYQGATVVHGPVSVVDGAAATPTVTGTYHVYQQYESQTMRGENADGSNYETEGVPWVTYFYLGYALHGAPWRDNFGYSDSHGCLNMPVSEAQWFFNWSEIGTTVVSHY